VVRDLALGPYQGKETGETALFRALWETLEAGEVVLGDRYFGSFFGIAGLGRRGVDVLFRMHQRRKYDFRRGRRLGIEDHVVTWTKPERPEWMDEATYAQIPDELTVRELRVTVDQPGFRVNELVLVTTMLDEELYTKGDLADLFIERWNIELDFRAIKCVIQMDVLRCKTPEMVRKEIWMHLLAYKPDPRCDGSGGRGPRQAAAPVELQGGVADDDGVPGRVATGDAERAGPLARGDAQGDLAPPRGQPVRPRRTARQQTPTEAAALPHRASRSGAQTLDAKNVRKFRVPFVSERLNGVSRIEMGFPHDLFARDMIRSVSSGGIQDQIDA